MLKLNKKFNNKVVIKNTFKDFFGSNNTELFIESTCMFYMVKVQRVRWSVSTLINTYYSPQILLSVVNGNCKYKFSYCICNNQIVSHHKLKCYVSTTQQYIAISNEN